MACVLSPIKLPGGSESGSNPNRASIKAPIARGFFYSVCCFQSAISSASKSADMPAFGTAVRSSGSVCHHAIRSRAVSRTARLCSPAARARVEAANKLYLKEIDHLFAPARFAQVSHDISLVAVDADDALSRAAQLSADCGSQAGR